MILQRLADDVLHIHPANSPHGSAGNLGEPTVNSINGILIDSRGAPIQLCIPGKSVAASGKLDFELMLDDVDRSLIRGGVRNA
jgi:hypothetical protein